MPRLNSQDRRALLNAARLLHSLDSLLADLDVSPTFDGEHVSAHVTGVAGGRVVYATTIAFRR